MNLLRTVTAPIALAACLSFSCGGTTSDPGADGGGTQGIRIRPAAVSKVDLLLAIDNSASMGDKQALFAEVIPDLIQRLVRPQCLDDDGSSAGGTADSNGKCAKGTPEFQPVLDLHIGIVSSSLGSRGGNACPQVPERQADDRGHLLNRGAGGKPVANATPGNFLAWLPPHPKNEGKPKPVVPAQAKEEALVADFRELVIGTGTRGCGFEAQLESAYRFLVQPDPYATIERKGDGVELRDIDRELLVQRRDFLRPDSLVGIIMLTDENESTIDPLAMGGRAWLYEETGDHVKSGTAICATQPNDPACISCYSSAATGKPECNERLREAEDGVNVRFFHPKKRFGIDPRFPVERYAKGFREPRVPNREGEHPAGAPAYVGDPNCTNPLFARDLPDGRSTDAAALCNLPRGPRTADLVFFALLGGVPWQLLTDENKPGAPFKDKLEAADWQRILGSDPLRYDFTGADPRMIESVAKRPEVPGDWDTRNNDVQYACTFDLPPSMHKNCAAGQPDAAYCDCSLSNGQEPTAPLCAPNPKDGNKKTLQTRGKAYPTVNQLAVAKMLGPQAIVASLCPRTVEPSSTDYGYRPAVRAIASRMKEGLTPQCLPKPVSVKADGTVACTLFTVLPTGEQAAACDPAKGLSQPDPASLQRFRDQQRASGERELPVCLVQQLTQPERVDGSCEASSAPGWCYVAGTNAVKCPQAIAFSPAGTPPEGAISELHCGE